MEIVSAPEGHQVEHRVVEEPHYILPLNLTVKEGRKER
jgi:hypothetical protein